MVPNRSSSDGCQIRPKDENVGRDAGAHEQEIIHSWHMLIKNEPYRTMNREMVVRKYKKMERESNMV